MKRFVGMLGALCLLSSLSAQGLTGGLSLGMNASQVDGDAVSGFNQAGLSLGGFVAYHFSDQVAFQPEILYEQLGSSSQGFLLLKTNQISVPLLLQLTLPVELGNNTQAVQFHAGPVIGILLKARNFNEDVTQSLKRTDLRIVGGLSYRFTRSLSFMLRYGYSILSFIDTNVPLAASLVQPGRGGLAHHYVNIAFRIHLSD